MADVLSPSPDKTEAGAPDDEITPAMVEAGTSAYVAGARRRTLGGNSGTDFPSHVGRAIKEQDD